MFQQGLVLAQSERPIDPHEHMGPMKRIVIIIVLFKEIDLLSAG